MSTRRFVPAVLLSSAVALAGCQNTREGLEKDAENAAPKIERAAEQTAAVARVAGREAAKAAESAAEAIRKGVGEAAQAGDGAQQTAQIKSALMADASIDSTTIDVDTDGDTRTVTLKGQVRSASEKAAVARIAAAKAPGYTIANRLDVRR